MFQLQWPRVTNTDSIHETKEWSHSWTNKQSYFMDLLNKRPTIIWTIPYPNRPLCTTALFLELERRRRVKELSWFFSSQTWFLASTELLSVVSSHYYVVIEYIYYTSDVSFSLERVIILSVCKMTDQFIIGIV